MEINISGPHIEITDAMNTYARKKLGLLSKYNDKILHIDVIFSAVRADQKVEANVHIKGKILHAEATSNDMYTSIDNLEDKLAEQLKKIRAKSKNHKTKLPPKKQTPSTKPKK
jgi:putative sigma-54 modulation protein